MSILSSFYSGVQNSISAVTSAMSTASSRVFKGITHAVGSSIARTTMGVVIDKIKPTPPNTEPENTSPPDGLIETVQDFFGKAGTAATEFVSQTKTRVIEEVAMAAIDTTIEEIKGHITEGVASLGAGLGKSAAETLESFINEGSDSLDASLGTIGKKFRGLLESYKEKIDTGLQQKDLSASQQLGFNLANLLHDKLSDLGDACFQAKKLSIDAFKQQSTDAINRAKPGIEKELGEVFVNYLLAPLTSFLQGLMSSVIKSCLGFFKEKVSAPTTQIVPEASQVAVSQEDAGLQMR